MTPEELGPWIKRGKRERYYRPEEGEGVAWDRGPVERLLPHRDPFLFVDRVTAVSADRTAIAGQVHLAAEADLFRGHFPGDPLFPGMLQLEAIGQLALCLLASAKVGDPGALSERTPPAVRALKVHHALFLAPVRPPAEVTLVARVLHHDDWVATCAGQVLVGDTIASLGIMEVYFVDA